MPWHCAAHGPGSWFGQVPVDGGPGDAEFQGDALDGVGRFPVVVLFFIHFAGQFGVEGTEFGFCPPVSPSRVRSDISACSNAPIEPRMWKDIRTQGVVLCLGVLISC